MSSYGRMSAVWRRVPDDIDERLQQIFQRHPGCRIFFRADDIAIPSRRQNLLLETFVRHDMPLCAAIVPTWITPGRWRQICAVVGDRHELFCWHQHGYSHRNHQTEGKKQEFGPGLEAQLKRRHVIRGRDRLAEILGEHFLPVFTPPWNRLDQDTLQILGEEGFLAISRYRGDRLAAPPGLPDLACNVDLHTRREANAREGWQALLAELEQAMAGGLAGIMLHHNRMNGTSFLFLERLLGLLGRQRDLRLCLYPRLLGELHGKEAGRP